MLGEVILLHEIRWTARKIEQRIELIEPLVYRRRASLPPFRFTTLPDPDPGPIEPAPVGVSVDDSGWDWVEANTYWAGARVNFVLRTQFQIPADWPRDATVALYLPLGEPRSFSHPEALAYVDGEAYGTCDRHHQEIILRDAWRDGQSHVLALHGWTGNSHGDGVHGRLLNRECQVVQIDQPTRDFIAAARVALGVAKMLDEHEPAKDRLLTALNNAFNMLDVREPFGDAFYASVAPAYEALRQGIDKAGPPLDVWITATGHAHIDVAWWWTLGQTRRKSGRTFYNVLRLMEQFPDYHFTQSQPQLYDYVREDYPALFEEIRARVAEDRWELIGGMWVEADCNLSGAESLARQFLLGRGFFRRHFGEGAESPVLWLPDVFGYAWALPQLIKLAGLDYFFTIKIGWSQYNRLPYDSFWWQGVDGTKVLTHFSTAKDPESPFASTYNSAANPAETIGTWMNFQQKEIQQDLLMAFGYGDGGGGPTREMLENLREMANFPATPRVHQRHVGEFFRELEAQHGDQLPTWNGELYLEIHRGTYTTQSRNKRANRKSEFLLHDAEFLATVAALLDVDYRYPASTFNKAWELVCLNQFHDIIPGSSIHEVYVDSAQQYQQITEMGTAARDEALAVIVRSMQADILLANPTSFARSDLAFWQRQINPRKRVHRADGTTALTQATRDGTLIAAGELRPYSITGLQISDDDSTIPETGLVVTNTLLENDFIRVELSDAGDIVRVYDKVAAREVLSAGAIANQLQAFEDRPMNWDAWDIDIFYDDKMWLSEAAESVQVVEQGPLRATLEIRRRILNSDYVQRVSLCYNSPQLDFDTTIDWRERHILLKAAFPVEILSPVATYEIQWGNVQRPTHHNTSWDWARFETCAQKWVDLSEGGYGVSLLNDCKYGHDIHGSVIRISLLRSPTSPDPEADQGEHRFAYSLLPHVDGWNERTIGAAYALNDPIIVAGGDKFAASADDVEPVLQSLVAADQPNVVIETVKRAEDGDGVIVRLYESHRQRGSVTLRTGFPLKAAWQANLLEDNEEPVAVDGNEIRLTLRPYQIMTLRLLPA
jgi:alpha-mannosidase